MTYADFDYYRNTYFGKIIDETDFPRLSLRASSFLDYYTQGRAEAHPEMDALKMACCALAEQYQALETAQELANKSLSYAMESSGGELQSETVGGYSVSRRSGGDTAASALSAAQAGKTALASIAQQYLAGTGLLYRGGCRHVHAPHCDCL